MPRGRPPTADVRRARAAVGARPGHLVRRRAVDGGPGGRGRRHRRWRRQRQGRGRRGDGGPRPPGGRDGHPRRSGAAAGQCARRPRRRCRAGAAGPAPGGSGAVAVHRGERHDDRAGPGRAVRPHLAGPSRRPGQGHDRRPDDQGGRAAGAGLRVVRRQPAEGRHGPGAGQRPAVAGAHHADRRGRRAVQADPARRSSRTCAAAAPPCWWSPTNSTICATATGCW